MRRSLLVVGCCLVATACGPDELSSLREGDPVDEGPPEPFITIDAAHADSNRVDRIGPADGALSPDGAVDGALALTLAGPFVALSLLTVDEGGVPDGQVWDSYVGAQPLPDEVSAGAPTGEVTFGLVLVRDGVILNEADGSLPALAGGRQEVALFASQPPPNFVAGRHFRVFGRLGDGTLVGSNVFAYPGLTEADLVP